MDELRFIENVLNDFEVREVVNCYKDIRPDNTFIINSDNIRAYVDNILSKEAIYSGKDDNNAFALCKDKLVIIYKNRANVYFTSRAYKILDSYLRTKNI